MGVPSYFYWLVRHFEDDIISHSCPFEITHHLYLDFNGAIHPAVRSKPEISLKEMYMAVLKYLEYIIDIVDPVELIWIAIDGVAPLAKMKQQRIRRFKSVKEVTEINQLKKLYGITVDEKNQKDFNMISPATQFMSDLSNLIQNFIKEHKQGKYKHLKIIFVDASVPGEGEHKILKYIKTQPIEKNCLIYGLDSDLIFLSLSTQKQNIALIRENTLIKDNGIDIDIDKFPQMAYFLVDELRYHLINILNPYTSLSELENENIFSIRNTVKTSYTSTHQKTNIALIYEKMKAEEFFTTEKEIRNVIIDYIFISFLLGNDFIPPVESLKIKEGGIEQILRAYKIIIQKKRQFLISEDLKINTVFFFELIQTLSENELESLKKQKRSRDKRLKSIHINNHPQNFIEALNQSQYVENQYKDQINVYADDWENRYYDYFFHIKTTQIGQRKIIIEKICDDYIRALHWIMQYYFNDCPDWYWYYPHEATPLLSDLALYLSNQQNINQIEFTLNAPVQPFHQLLIILPPQSSHLLPKPFIPIMTSDDSPIIHYYPTDFEFEYYGKRHKWECHPKVPMVNPTELIKYLTYINEKLTTEEKHRNTRGHPLEFN